MKGNLRAETQGGQQDGAVFAWIVKKNTPRWPPQALETRTEFPTWQFIAQPRETAFTVPARQSGVPAQPGQPGIIRRSATTGKFL
jgi:hypothetical protein